MGRPAKNEGLNGLDFLRVFKTDCLFSSNSCRVLGDAAHPIDELRCFPGAERFVELGEDPKFLLGGEQ